MHLCERVLPARPLQKGLSRKAFAKGYCQDGLCKRVLPKMPLQKGFPKIHVQRCHISQAPCNSAKALAQGSGGGIGSATPQSVAQLTCEMVAEKLASVGSCGAFFGGIGEGNHKLVNNKRQVSVK